MYLYSLQASAGCNYQQATAGQITVVLSERDDNSGADSTDPDPNTVNVVGSSGFQVGASQPGLAGYTLTFNNLPLDTYTVEWYDSVSGLVRAMSGTVSVDCSGGSLLTLVALTATAVTATASGTIKIQVSGGTLPVTASIPSLALTMAMVSNAQGVLEATFTNIPAGTYLVKATDTTNPTATVQGTATVDAYVVPVVRGCTDPTANNYNASATQDDGSCTYTPAAREAYFEVPPMQSLRFVQPLRAGRLPFDNTLLADEQPLDFYNPGYCQLVAKSDRLVIQVLSNYVNAPVLKLRVTATSPAVRTITGVRVQQGAGETAAFPVYVKPDVSGKVRVYFNEDALPLPFAIGGRITLAGTGTSLDGTYPIQQVLEDAAAAVPYLVLTATYPSGSVRVDGTLTTTYKIQAYDTYQLVVPFNEVATGCYQAYITATDPDFSQGFALSEPLDVATAHAGSLLISYRNFDNAFGLNYSHGLVNRLRVTGRFFNRQASTEKNVLRNNNDELELLSAHARRNVELEVLQAPGYLHEVLAVAFCHDFTTIEGVRGTVAGEYTYAVVERYTLGKGTASLEVKPFLGSGNADDLGDVDQGGGPFLYATDDFLLAR